MRHGDSRSSDASIFATDSITPSASRSTPTAAFFAGGEAGQIYRISARRQARRADRATPAGFILGVAISPDGELAGRVRPEERVRLEAGPSRAKLSELSRAAPATRRSASPTISPSRRDGNALRHRQRRLPAGQREDPPVRRRRHGRRLARRAVQLRQRHRASAPDEATRCSSSARGCPASSGSRFAPTARPGSAASTRSFRRRCPDGLAFDARGNLYVICYAPARIYKVTPRAEGRASSSTTGRRTRCRNPHEHRLRREEVRSALRREPRPLAHYADRPGHRRAPLACHATRAKVQPRCKARAVPHEPIAHGEAARDLGPLFADNPHRMVGQDGAFSIPLDAGETLWFFGDTLDRPPPPAGQSLWIDRRQARRPARHDRPRRRSSG